MKKKSYLLVGLIAFLCGCVGGGGGSDDVSDQAGRVYVALGDSITQGRVFPVGAPYPERLAGILETTVVNAGVSGATAAEGAARASSLISSHEPHGVLILFGANDVIQGVPPSVTIAALASIIEAAKAAGAIPYLATLTPQLKQHVLFSGHVKALNERIRSLASSQGAQLVDLADEFGEEESLLQGDGLHPSDAGTQVIAFSFADRID